MQAPAHFQFAVKASRLISHLKKLAHCEQALEALMQSAAGFGDKLGPILWQLPPNWHLNLDRLRAFLAGLPKHHRHALEFRDPTWHCQPVYQLLREFNAAFCLFGFKGAPSPEVLTTDFVYLRLHGPIEAYARSYSEDALKQWAEKMQHWQAAGKTVYVFFNNDARAMAVSNARTLRASCRR